MSFLVYIPIAILAFVLFTVFDRLSSGEGGSRTDSLIFALFCAPIVLSIILYHLLLLFPGRTDSFYVSIIALILLLGATACLPVRQNFFRDWRSALSAGGRALRVHPVRSALLAAALLLIGIKTIAWPFISDDATCYALLGRYFYATKSVLNYPMRAADDNGMIIIQNHPLGQILLYTLSSMFSGDAHNDLAWRSISFYYLCVLLALVWAAASRLTGRQEAGWVATLVLMSAPVITLMAIFNTLDPARFAGMLASFYAFYFLFNRPKLRLVALAAIVTACALYVHFSGLLILCVLVAFVVADRAMRLLPPLRDKLPQKPAPIIATGGLILLSLLPLAAHLLLAAFPAASPAGAELANVRATSSQLFGNINPAWLVDEAGPDASWWQACLSRIAFAAFAPRLRPFFNVTYFSLAFWAWLAGAISLISQRKRLKAGEHIFLLASTIAFVAILILRYGNPRYISTVLPLAAVVAAMGFRRMPRNRALRYVLACCLFFASVTPFAVASLMKGSLADLFRPSLEKRLRITRDFRGARDYFKALDYIDSNLPPNERVLLFRHAPFFYYTANEALTFRHSKKLDGFRRLYARKGGSLTEVWRELKLAGCCYVLTDPAYSHKYKSYRDSIMPELLSSELAQPVFQSGEVILYRIVQE